MPAFSPVLVRRAAVFLAALGLAAPAAAELQCSVSKTRVGQYESVGITVRDPRQGLDIKPGPLQVTMADSADHRQDLFLEPTGRAGEWSGRFTPLRTGRYTGTALVERGDQKDLGLVPLIRVAPSGRRGFVRLNPRTRRALQYTSGATLFPIGVRLVPEDLRAPVDWRRLFARLRANEINFIQLPVAWPADLSPAEQAVLYRNIDTALVEAERTGRMAVMLRLEGPVDRGDQSSLQYEAQLQQYARRWAYSPALAVFYIAGAADDVSPDLRLQWVRSLRAMDPYRHLVALPGARGDSRAGGDILVLNWDWQRPTNRFALLEAPEQLEGPTPLPGESSWQMLAVGGVGLPLWPFRLDAPESGAVLERIRRMAKVAGHVPYQAPGQLLTGVVAVDTPGSFARYGKTCVGWVAPDTDRVLNLSQLPRGRYRVRFFDPGRDQEVSRTEIWATGQSARVELPQNLRAVYVQAEPVSGAQPAPRAARRTARRAAPRPQPAPHVAAVRRVVKKPSRAELRRQKLAAKKEAARQAAAKKAAAKKAAARKKKPTRAELRRQKAAARKEAAKKASARKASRKKPAAKSKKAAAGRHEEKKKSSRSKKKAEPKKTSSSKRKRKR